MKQGELLLNAGADPLLEDIDGMSAMIIEDIGSIEYAQFLRVYNNENYGFEEKKRY
ncbi:hypothetical protein KHA80_07255 [Anaerobacillus sp. HL2]|nr:hypothetical protein KHA80_07255 [Anaerobacillus sp. HL2]